MWRLVCVILVSCCGCCDDAALASVCSVVGPFVDLLSPVLGVPGSVLELLLGAVC